MMINSLPLRATFRIAAPSRVLCTLSPLPGRLPRTQAQAQAQSQRRSLATHLSPEFTYDAAHRAVGGSDYEQLRMNWSENVKFGGKLVAIDSVEQLQDEVAAAPGLVRVVGSGHCFNHICEAPEGKLLSLAFLSSIFDPDVDNMTVAIEGGVTYGPLCRFLGDRGAALENLASLPQPTVVGATATATHGSGATLGSLTTQVASMDVVLADGSIRTFSRQANLAEFNTAAVHLGALGVVSRLELDIVPSYDVLQRVYTGMQTKDWIEGVEEWAVSNHAPAAHVEFGGGETTTLWYRDLLPEEGDETVVGADGVQRTRNEVLELVDQPPPMGGSLVPVGHPGLPFFESGRMVPCTFHGRWDDVLMFFSKDRRDVPMGNLALHTEYFVDLKDAKAAMYAVWDVAKKWEGWSTWDLNTLDPSTALGPLMSEIRVIKGDDIALSPMRARDVAVAIHFTLPRMPGNSAAMQMVRDLDHALKPFGAKPHWGKLFASTPQDFKELYGPGLDEFLHLRESVDPLGKFANPFVRHYLMGQ